MPKQAPARLKGISEREKGSGIFWIRWTDAEGRRHFEKAGNRGAAEFLLSKRKQDVIIGKKQPELLRTKAVTFGELCDDAVKYSRDANSEKQTYELALHIKKFKVAFGNRRADAIKKNEIIDWLAEQTRENNWKPSSRNRAQAAFSLIFRVGIDNEKIDRNPAARIRRKTENNVRFTGSQ